MKKKQLEITLERVRPHPTPRERWEQYSTPAVIASDLLWTALLQGNIRGRKVGDLGCGTGILSIGAKLLGASEVVGIDLDPKAIEIAISNAKKIGVDIRFGVMKVAEFHEECDTIVMNPPFGAQRRHADMPFLITAIKYAPAVYSLHLIDTEKFIKRQCEVLGASATVLKTYIFAVPHMFVFHTKEMERIRVALFKIEREDGN